MAFWGISGSLCKEALRNLASRLCWGLNSLCRGTNTGGSTEEGQGEAGRGRERQGGGGRGREGEGEAGGGGEREGEREKRASTTEKAEEEKTEFQQRSSKEP